jgi:Tfp pilus assembly protein PilF
MKRIAFIVFSAVLSIASYAQPDSPQETARSFMRVGDWDNAILVLNKALQSDPNNLELSKDLAFSYLYDKNYAKALEVIKPLLERDDADVPTFQIAGNIYKALEEVKDADKMYKKALKKFPGSGALYSEYGELLWNRKDYDAIGLWEKGIEVDPSYAGNYYNAASYYYFSKDKVWTLVYGEIFINMENLTERATEVKRMLLDTYKEKLFMDLGKDKEKNKSAFAEAVFQTYQKQTSLLSKGITMETLNMLRTRFILDWYNTYSTKYPFKLFDYQQQLIREGMFESYNQWLFAIPENLPAFDQWTKANAEAYNKFTNFQKNRVFKMPSGQHYNSVVKN